MKDNKFPVDGHIQAYAGCQHGYFWRDFHISVYKEITGHRFSDFRKNQSNALNTGLHGEQIL